MADRGPVRLRQGRIDDLIGLYQQTYTKLVKEIIDSTTAGQIQKAKVMSRINAELTSLGVDVDAWVKKEIPQYYLDGANDAIRDLKAQGIVVDKSGMAVINRRAITALTDETALAFAEGIRGVSRNARRVLSDALKQQINFTIAEGKLTGESRKLITDSVTQRLRDNGLSAIVDKGGRQWTLDRYSEMLVRTKAVEARNQGLINRMLQSGYDLVQISNHGSSHPECHKWEGKIVSVTGKTPGYPTLDRAMVDGIFHPNCQHALNVINPDLAAKTEAYDNPYLRQDDGNRPLPPPDTPNKSLVLKKGQRTVNVPLRPQESRFIERTNLNVLTTPPRRSGSNVQGFYQPWDHSIVVKGVDKRTKEASLHTFYHELGHAIDYQAAERRITYVSENMLVIKKAAEEIAITRIIASWHTKLTKTEARKILAGGSTSDGYHMTPLNRRYLRKDEEVFAEGYALWRINPAAFTKKYPDLAKIYEEVI